MKSVLAAVALTVLCVACGTKRNEERCLEGLCSNPDLPFCDIDGTVGGEPNSCIAVDCSPGEIAGCRDDRALTCNPAGDNYDLLQCPSGCDPAIGCKPCNTPECEKHIIPKYLPTICDQLSPADPVTITQDTTIDNTNALNCSSVVPQSNGVDICVLRYSALTIEANRTLTFTGPRAVAIVVDREFTMAGILDVGAKSSKNGPGGGVLSGTCPGATGGCGGAGYRTPGGSGAGTGAAGNGGAMQTSPAQLSELRGGTRSNTGTSAPGGAGGAATLIACRGQLTVTGMIDANGGGGAGDRFLGSFHQAAGGGSGGTIVLQGMSLMATGQFYANGGGGGAACGACALGESGGPGQDGPRSTDSALGGSSTGGGLGGRGGSRDFAPGDGTPVPANTIYGGGGGGSAGFFFAYGPSSGQAVVSPVAASPAFFPTGTIATN